MKKLYLSFIWHQHQPYYKNLRTGEVEMPWVRLHAVKDYADMPALLELYPKLKATFNLVPSLLLQLEEFVEGKAVDLWMKKLLIPSKDLTPEDKLWMLKNFFLCHWETMVAPYPRYQELLNLRGLNGTDDALQKAAVRFSPQDFCDLGIWFHLAWTDPLWQAQNPTIKRLLNQQKNFSEADKQAVLDAHREIAAQVIPIHKKLWDLGQIEISTTPFYHPILPLLCDTDAADMAMPQAPKPKERFAHPEDARLQIEKALEFMESRFGHRPRGMWPSEGSVSEKACELLSQAGVKWIATDEAVLYESMKLAAQNLERRAIFEPHAYRPQGQNPVNIFFRDHGLSDAIGFHLSKQPAATAVEDFIRNLEKIAEAFEAQAAPPLVSIILDGENCWEYYPQDGHPFLKALYQRLSDHPFIETTTPSLYLEKYPQTHEIKRLWPGSWIGGNFAIWIGHPEDNAAWDLVSTTRRFLMKHLAEHPEKTESQEGKLALESFYAAEGSDWCWWYGDQNFSALDQFFDRLFREHLKNVYTFLGAMPPENLWVPIKRETAKSEIDAPMSLIAPKIDGIVGNFFEWRGAGWVDLNHGGAMHVAETWLSGLYFGFDLKNLYLRLEPRAELKDAKNLGRYRLKVIFVAPANQRLEIFWGEKLHEIFAEFHDSRGEFVHLRSLASKKIVEIAIPFTMLGVSAGDKIEFLVNVCQNENVLESWPVAGPIHAVCPSEDFGSDVWSA